MVGFCLKEPISVIIIYLIYNAVNKQYNFFGEGYEKNS